MTYPIDWIEKPVSGNYSYSDKTIPQGPIYFNSKQVLIIDGIVVIPRSRSVLLTFEGKIPAGFTLPSTNDPAALPAGWYYTVIEAFPGGRPPYRVFLAFDGPGIDLATVDATPL